MEATVFNPIHVVEGKNELCVSNEIYLEGKDD